MVPETATPVALAHGVADQPVIVTGAAGGIGRAVAHLLADHRARLCLVDLDGDALEALRADLPYPDRHVVEPVDLRVVAAFDPLVERAERSLGGPLWGLVSVAAVLRRRAEVTEVTEADWDAQHDVNLKASFFLARAAAEAMRRGGRGGRVVCFSSQGWWTGGFGGSVAYSASKGGVVSMVRGLARTYGPDAICVNVIAPGLVNTSMLLDDLSDDVLEQLTDATPLGRVAEPAEVATMVAFLLSEHASYVTGATLNVSGGLVMY